MVVNLKINSTDRINQKTAAEMKIIRLAAILTCHNRREKTLACLQSFFEQKAIDGVEKQVYLVDAGSTDGTVDAIRRAFPSINIIQKDNSLFWCGGMRVGFGEAMTNNFDYYLWLNDDTLLFPNAVRTLIDTSCLLKKQTNRDVIVVGSIKDPQSGTHTYGGIRWKRYGLSLSLDPVEPCDEPQSCDTVNGNCVLIPREIAHSVGNISPDFTHGIGDFDYGLRAKAKKFSCWLAPGIVGTCPMDRLNGSCRDSALSIRQRVRKMVPPKGVPPTWEWLLFTKRHTGIFWPLYWLRTLVRFCCPYLWVLVRGNRY